MFKKTFAAFFIFATMQSYAAQTSPAQPSLDEIIVERKSINITDGKCIEHVTLNFQHTQLDYIMSYPPVIEGRRAAIGVGKNVFLKCYAATSQK